MFPLATIFIGLSTKLISFFAVLSVLYFLAIIVAYPIRSFWSAITLIK